MNLWVPHKQHKSMLHTFVVQLREVPKEPDTCVLFFAGEEPLCAL